MVISNIWATAQYEKHSFRRMELKYRFQLSGTAGKWSGWRKTTKTVEQLQGMLGHPKVQAVEWKEEK